MANKYWAAGVSGNWNSITSWSDFAIGTPAGAVVPGTGDAAIFNAASGTVTATLDISPTIQTLTCTGFTGTLAFGTNTISLNSTGTVFTGATTMTVTGTPQIICTNNSATARTITPTAVTEANSISFRITAGTGTLGLTAGSYRNLDFTDGTNPTGYGGALTGSTSITIYGDLKASTNMTVGAGGGVFTFAATSGTKTINTAGVTFDKPFTFNGVGGTWQLQSALTSGASRACTLTAGTLDLNNYTLTTGLFSTNNANARTIAFGTGNITITGVSGTVFAGPTSANTGLTTTGTAQVNVTGNGITTRTVNPGNAAAITGFISFTISNGSDTINSSAGMTFNNLTFTSGFTGTFGNVSRSIFGNLTLDPAITSFSSGASTLTFTGTGVQTITTANETIDCPITFDGIGGTFVLVGDLTLGSTKTLTFANGIIFPDQNNNSTITAGSFVTTGTNQKLIANIVYPTYTSALSVASGTVSVSYLNIEGINAIGGAVFQAFLSNFNGDLGNNTGWDFGVTPAISNEITMRLRSFTQPRRF